MTPASDSEFTQSEDDGNTSSEMEPIAKKKRRLKVAKIRQVDEKELDDADDDCFSRRIRYEV